MDPIIFSSTLLLKELTKDSNDFYWTAEVEEKFEAFGAITEPLQPPEGHGQVYSLLRTFESILRLTLKREPFGRF